MPATSRPAPRRSLFENWTNVTLPDGRVVSRQMLPRPPIRGVLGIDALGSVRSPFPEPTPNFRSGWFARSSFKNAADFDRIRGAVGGERFSLSGMEGVGVTHALEPPTSKNAGPMQDRSPAPTPAEVGMHSNSQPGFEELSKAYRQVMIKREGNRNDVYADSLGKPTVGIGHLVRPSDHLKLGDIISDEKKEALWRADSSAALAAAHRQAAEAGIADRNFQMALADVNFQLGPGWNKSFRPTWDLIVQGKYEEAASRLQKSKWYKQTPNRVKNFQKALLELRPKQS